MGTRGRNHHAATRMVSRSLLTLTGLLALFLAGCTASGGQRQSLASSQVFTWPYINATAVQNKQWDVAVLDPAVITEAIDSSNIAMLYSGLVTLNSSTLQVQPDAASSWDITNSGKSYVFHLRPNLFFSDGTPMTARSFAYSIDRAIGPTDPTTGKSLVCNVDDSQSYALDGECNALGGDYLSMIVGAQAKTGPVTHAGGARHPHWQWPQLRPQRSRRPHPANKPHPPIRLLPGSA